MTVVFEKLKHKLGKRIKSGGRIRIIRSFAEKSGLVYFGFVNQHSDEHKVVRGLTVSTTHKDDGYCIGTLNDYNVTVVDRSDSENYKGKLRHFSWLILTVELKTEYRIPHFFIAANGRDMDNFHPLFTSFPNMVEDTEASNDFGNDFDSRFKLYVRPAKVDDLEKVLTPDITKVLSAHLWPYSVEQHDNVLYVYADCADITESMLSMMLKNGLFLAHSLDSNADQITD